MAYTGAIGVDDRELVGVLDTAHALGALVTSHCEHGEAVVALQNRLFARGLTEPRWHARSRPSYLEGEATNRVIQLARAAGEGRNGHDAHPHETQPIYIVHLTAKESMDAVYRARAEGQKVLVEITKIDDRGKLSLAPVTEGDEGASSADDAEGDDD
jgi:dihydropyrimidinase